jgi:ATP-dependent Clp protease ATP-binding subunit ClpA
MRLLPRARRVPRAKTIRPAEPYLFAGSQEARRLGHNYVGTEHILSVLIRDPDGTVTQLLARLGITAPQAGYSRIAQPAPSKSGERRLSAASASAPR